MVINNNKNKNQLFKITDISKAFSEGNVMKQFETEVKLFFEDIDILERKKIIILCNQRMEILKNLQFCTNLAIVWIFTTIYWMVNFISQLLEVTKIQ